MANTLELGNGKWATGKDTVLAFNDENNNFKPLPFDFSRASSATVVNQSGLIETVGSGTPRIDFKDNTKGALLLEPTRSNVLLQSNQFDTTWLKNNVTILGGQSGIYGSSDAWLLQRGDGLARFLGQTVSISSSSTLSVYAKKGNSNWLFLSDGTGKNKYFDLENGVIGNVGTASNSLIELIGNGWYRCSITVSNGESRIYPAVGDGVVSGLVGANIYIQHAQLEVGSYPTSIIPTSGSAVTRVGDSCNNGANSQVINSTEGVLYAEMSALANDSTNRYISVSDGTNTNRIILRFSTANRIRIDSVVGTNQFNAETNVNANQFYKAAFSYKQNEFKFYINGVLIGSSTSGNVPSSNTYNLVAYQNPSGGEVFYGETRDLRIYNTSLTDAELQALTTI